MKPTSRMLIWSTTIIVVAASAYGLIRIRESTSASAGSTFGEDPQQKSGRQDRGRTESYTIDVTNYNAPQSPWETLLTDDQIRDKKTTFDSSLVHPAAIEGWQLNLSDAIIRLDVPMIRPDQDKALLELHPSYASAIAAARKNYSSWEPPLPSVNLIDDLAKQFDDGLYAALDQAYYKGLNDALGSHVALVKVILERVGPNSSAAPFLAAGLELAGQAVAVNDTALKEKYLSEFASNPVLSKPIGVYTWNPTLGECYRFLRFFQRSFSTGDPVASAIGDALASDPDLKCDYEKANAFYARLTNPLKRGTMLQAVEFDGSEPQPKSVALFPASSSREGELFERLFPNGLPPNTDLMREFVTRIRKGEVELATRPSSGWYDYQVYALETMLLPERGAEHDKLLLTKGYKRRMLEAFQALMTKRRETHVRQLDIPKAEAAAPKRDLRIAPPLRIEPSLTYYLRTARAYAFLMSFLESTVGDSALKTLHALRQEGPREKDFYTELRDMRDLFYGFYQIGCEDIGMKPEFMTEESLDPVRGRELAAAWLAGDWSNTPDLKTDTRVAVPIYYDPVRNTTRLWVTLGVRLAKLNVGFARGPRVRVAETEGEWEELPNHQLESKNFVIPVDEFAEIELNGLHVFTRDELRAICDKYKTKEAILKALQR